MFAQCNKPISLLGTEWIYSNTHDNYSLNGHLIHFPCLYLLQNINGENLAPHLVKTLRQYPREALAVMLDSGLNFALQDHDGYTPLMHAADIGCMSGMTALLGLSALLGRDVALGFGSTNADNCGRGNVLHLMAAGRDTTSARVHRNAVLELLLAHPDMDDETVNAVDIYGQTPLHMAFHSTAVGDCASIFLRSPKVLRGDSDNFGNTPLHRLLNSAFSLLGQHDHKFTPGYVNRLLWELLHWKTNEAPVIDIFAKNHYGFTGLDLAFRLCDGSDGFEDSLCILADCIMHGRK